MAFIHIAVPLLLALLRSTQALQISNAETSLTFLYQNNLNASDDGNHAGAILLDPSSNATTACQAISESLISRSTLQAHSSDFFHSLAYLKYSGQSPQRQQYQTQDGLVAINQQNDGLSFQGQQSGQEQLPILCTQSGLYDTSKQLSVSSNGNTFTGFRNPKSFRFLGIPYADPPSRFEYSTLYSKKGETIDALSYGSNCAQAFDPSSSEDCLFLNIQTPYIPRANSTTNLRPVLFTIHGGGFTGGSGQGADTGNLASRHDIVGVQINYRLSTLGFFAVPNTTIKGNFGISDQITALRWVRENIANFGGDPNKITIIGESAGASSVRTLLGSPPVISENLVAGAVAQSNLGGGVTLGQYANYGTSFSSYYSIEQSYAVAGQQIFTAAGCTQSEISSQIDCLKKVDAQTLQSLSAVARYVVQDGTYVNTEQLIVSTKNSSTAHVPVIWGTTLNDGASLAPYPSTPVNSIADGLIQSLYISDDYAQAILDSGLFPVYDTGNVTLDSFNISQRVQTDTTFRCIDEATAYAGAKSEAFKKAWYYTFDRTYGGFDPNNLGASGLASGPISPDYPNGNPKLPYFRLHGSEAGFTYGLQYPLRDDDDLLASQLISGYFASFVRTGDPNFDEEYLRVRGYEDELRGVQESGRWEAVSAEDGPSWELDWPSRGVVFPEREQCAWLNYSIGYYLEGGS
ncbi:hypothetical protein PRZ48_007965 [Zasmidium cellare]|uniref:Carboxylic ester hydrolase n=1 Tax=Zasmidium cellare TaxID=395010 RepID=A0ABR0EE50_ZASCE|nr:hypothetical protein PRZ48_007965 [Zasmidium cellare]